MTDTPSTSPIANHAAGDVRRELVEIIRTAGLGLAIALALRIVVFQPFTIPSSSMEPGLVTGDYIVVSKLDYGWSRASFPLNPHCSKDGSWNVRPSAATWWCSDCRAIPPRPGSSA